jgi:hypothetical protein
MIGYLVEQALRRKVIARRLRAVETPGAASVICRQTMEMPSEGRCQLKVALAERATHNTGYPLPTN